MKILILYAGIGGESKVCDRNENNITAIEINPEIAKIRQDFFPEDKVIVCDAHKYLLEHYKEFDFIWSSPPCPTHSQLRKGLSMNAGAKAVYPDMKLYEEIIFLWGYFKGKWVVENVISWYNPLIKPFEVGRHYFWSNFIISNKKITDGKFSITGGVNKEQGNEQVLRLQKEFDVDLSSYSNDERYKRTLLRNMVNPKLGLHIFNCAFKEKQHTLTYNVH